MNKEEIMKEFNLSDYTDNPYELSTLQRVVDYCDSRSLIDKWAAERQFNRDAFSIDDTKGRIIVSKKENQLYKEALKAAEDEYVTIFQTSEPTEFIYNVTVYSLDRGAASFVIKKEVYDYLIDKYFNSETETKEQELKLNNT